MNPVLRGITIILYGASTGVITSMLYNSWAEPIPKNVKPRLNVETPQFKPDFTMESVNYAIHKYNIQFPKHGLASLTLNEDMDDRGTTAGYSGGLQKSVQLGPNAFISWSILGSTLAHEIEVHARQNFLKIALQEMYLPKFVFRCTGECACEYEAYTHELENAERFSLTAEEKIGILSIRNEFYIKP
jgi:hypothetical protein